VEVAQALKELAPDVWSKYVSSSVNFLRNSCLLWTLGNFLEYQPDKYELEISLLFERATYFMWQD